MYKQERMSGDLHWDIYIPGTGKLELIIGNMFSGKTTELIRRINREKSIKKKILLINHSSDTRYSTDSIVSHDFIKVECLSTANLLDIETKTLKMYDSVFIDEGQFFPDLFDFVEHLVDGMKKHVVVSGLDGDCNRNPFGDILRLIPISDSVDKLTAYCSMCKDGTCAPFTKKLTDDNEPIIDIGGGDKYTSLCRKHYLFY